ncbi:MAG TPA: glycosyltransferase family 39 protein [Nitrospiria bacterium]|jgi:4-amino-4-deoxy-L-arabinose transferase-like glycosyltransferase|nr:glycosyltransferase family 39 protein [Nitrospiria bacterium]
MTRNTGFWPALMLGGFLFFYQLGAVPLFDLDEAIYAETTREMVETGNWITPQVNYSPFYEKPILLYWFMGAAFKIFGPSEFAARLTSAVFGLALLVVTYGLTRRVASPRAGLLAMLILASNLEMVALSHAALTDMLLVFFITVSLASYYLLYKTERALWAVGIYLGAALAVLTKGPVGLVLPGMTIFLFILTVGPRWKLILDLRPGWGILIFGAIALPWYAAMFRLHGEAFWKSFFLHHNIERFTSVLGGHAGAPFYYLGILAIGFFPWVAFLPASVVSMFPGKDLSERWKNLRLFPANHPLEWFLLLWVAVVFLFFTLAGTKLPSYIAPAVPALAIWVARYMDRRMDAAPSTVRVEDRLTMGFTVGLTLITAVLILSIPQGIEWARVKFGALAPFLAQPIELNGVLMVMAGVPLIGVMTYYALLRLGRQWAGFMVLVLMMGVFVFVLLFDFIPSVSSYIQVPLRNLTQETRGWIRPEEPLVVFGLKKPSILFYARRGAVIFKSKQEEDLRRFLSAHGRAVVLSQIHLVPVLDTMPQLIIRSEQGGYVLATNF